MKKELIVYTDGASRGNPGPAGWGAVVLVDGYAMELAGGPSSGGKKSTNNQMELQAVLSVLSDSASRAYKGTVRVFSDSAYVVNGLNNWVYGWEKKGWITSTKTKVENKEIWIELLSLLKFYGKRLSIEKVKGHAGDLYNERCDELAVNVALGKEQELFKGKQKDYDKFLLDMGTTKKTSSKSASKKKTKSSGPAYSYVSLVDGKVYADKTWAECEKRVKGKKGAKYQKVFSKAEETSLVQDYTLGSLL